MQVVILSDNLFVNIIDSNTREEADPHFLPRPSPVAGFHRYVQEKVKKWRWTYEYVLRNTTRLHLLYYENLREAPLREIRALLAFLGVKPSEARLACLARHLEGGVKGAQREVLPYSNWERVDIQRAVDQVDALARGRGFPPLPQYSRYRN